MIGNRDEHLRNHGFLRRPRGWTLAPAFDVNPNPYKTHHALAIDESDPTPSVAGLRSTRDFYRLAQADALEIEAEVRAAVRSWETVASDLQLERAERVQLAAVIDPDRA